MVRGTSFFINFHKHLVFNNSIDVLSGLTGRRSFYVRYYQVI
nr:MAG TPA: hypothetical protein [Caudoviricetes sp.]